MAETERAGKQWPRWLLSRRADVDVGVVDMSLLADEIEGYKLRLAEVEAERDELVKVNAELGHYGVMQMALNAAQEQVRVLREAVQGFQSYYRRPQIHPLLFDSVLEQLWKDADTALIASAQQPGTT